MPAAPVSPRDSKQAVCSICQCPVLYGEAERVCEACGSRFHAACWDENGGCGAYGCVNAPESRKITVITGTESGAWGDTKACPSCGETLASSALKCPACKATFDGRAPMSPADYQAQAERKSAAKRALWLAILLFVGSALGILAPLTLVLSIAWMATRPEMFRKAAGAAELMVYGSCALSVAYVALMIAIFGAGW